MLGHAKLFFQLIFTDWVDRFSVFSHPPHLKTFYFFTLY
uniref:Uncharacterized protein n=1 Tax=Arundo donax TaxID=35708 RepID=A0A0A8YQA5_ARUDO